MSSVSNVNIIENQPLPSPQALMEQVVATPEEAEFIVKSRETIVNILEGKDDRFLLILGPCSIHDTKACLEYAKRLAELNKKVSDRIYLVMRVYFEKPRTTVGWKGLIMDPRLDGSCRLEEGFVEARQFLKQVVACELPTATELLDPITPQYIADLVSWAAIGARTTESQTHRQMTSGLSMPVGFKNTTYGGIKAAINAIEAASKPQVFLGVSETGVASAVSTKGNQDCHLILRGGDDGPNYDEASVEASYNALIKAGQPERIMIDASHANCAKDDTKMPAVFEAIIEQKIKFPERILGAMLESHLNAGAQSFPQPIEDLNYGQSITDKCINWETTEELVLAAYNKLG